MISASEVLMGRDKLAPLDDSQRVNLARLLKALNALRVAYGKPMYVSSGYRPAVLNKAIGGAKRSAHVECLACDFKDPDGALDSWCSANQDLLAQHGLWQEHPDHTPGWCHLDLRERPTRPRPNCLKRQFKP